MRDLVAIAAVVLGFVTACGSSESDAGGDAGDAGEAAGTAGAGRGGSAGSGGRGAGTAGAGGAGVGGANGAGTGGSAGKGGTSSAGTSSAGTSSAGTSSAGTSGATGAGGSGTSGNGGAGASGGSAAGRGGAAGSSSGAAAGSSSGAGTSSGGSADTGGEGGLGGEGGNDPGPLTCSAEFIQAQVEALVASFEEPVLLCTDPRMTGLGLSSGAYLVTACSAPACEGGEVGCGSEIEWVETPYLEADGAGWLVRGRFHHDFSCSVHFERSDDLVCDCTSTVAITGKTFRAPIAVAGSGTTLRFTGESVSFSSGSEQWSVACSGDVIDDGGVDGCNVEPTQIGGAASGECSDSLTDTHLGPLADRWFQHVTSFAADCSGE